MLDKLLGRNKKETGNDADNKDLQEGIGHVEKKEFEPAIESFKRCLKTDSEDSKAMVGLCIAYSGLMDIDTARDYYEKLKDIDPYLALQLENTPTGNLLKNEENSI